MSNVSESPDRHLFQKNRYIQRCKEKGVDPNQNYLEMFDNIVDDHKHKWADPERCKHNLEYDLLTTEWILEKVRNNDDYAQNLYAALCNNEFQQIDVLPILKEQTWHCSWRYAGGIVADMQQKGDYINWYCSGIRSGYPDPDDCPNNVSEGTVTEEVEQDLKRLNWRVIENNDDNI